jgi:hypothetical protein
LADDSVSDDIERLSDPGTQNANEVVGVGTGEDGSVTRDMIGDPSATGHANAQYLDAISGIDIG